MPKKTTGYIWLSLLCIDFFLAIVRYSPIALVCINGVIHFALVEIYLAPVWNVLSSIHNWLDFRRIKQNRTEAYRAFRDKAKQGRVGNFEDEAKRVVR